MFNKIGFIGLGVMGKPMAKNLMDVGYTVVAYDIADKPMEEILKYGAIRGESPKHVTESSDLILTMLPNSPQVEEVILGLDGVMEGVRKGHIIIDMSSIAPLVARTIAKKLEAVGVEMLDAPVSGGQEKAESGQLAFMVGGKSEVFDQCKKILEAMGKSVTLVGDAGAGQVTKLVNQVIVAINIAAVAEGLIFGKAAGVDPQKIVDAIGGGLAGSQCLRDKAPRMLIGKYDPGFRLRLHEKDLTNVFETSRKLHVCMPLSTGVMEMMQSLLSEGYEELDHGSLAIYYEKISGIILNTNTKTK